MESERCVNQDYKIYLIAQMLCEPGFTGRLITQILIYRKDISYLYQGKEQQKVFFFGRSRGASRVQHPAVTLTSPQFAVAEPECLIQPACVFNKQIQFFRV